MSNENISLNGTGKFQQNTENAGIVAYGEFSQAAVNTGSIAVSALFTGYSVNSGSIGGSLPYKTALLVQSNSAHWDAAFDAMADFVLLNDARLVDAREPLAHTQAISSIDGLEDALAAIDNKVPQSGALDLDHTDISDFDQAVADIANPLISTAVAGVDVSASISTAIGALDIAGTASGVVAAAAGVSVASLVSGLVPSSQLPSYVDDVLEFSTLASFPITGEAGKIYVDTTEKKIHRWSGSTYVEISPSPGSTDSVTEGSTNLYYTNTRASAAAPVQSVAGKTGAVTLQASDITGLSAAVVQYAPTAPSQLVSSVAGKTGVITLGTSDITGLQTALDNKQVAGSYVTTTVADALSSAIDGKQASGSYASASHVHAISAVTGLQTALDNKQASGSYASSVHTHSTSEITGFNAAAAAQAPVQSVAGRTGTVTLSASDIRNLSLTVLPISGGTMTGSIIGTTATFSTSISSSALSGVHYGDGSRLTGIASGVTSVAGKTGVVTLSTSDIQGLTTLIGNKTVSTSTPTGGVNGDFWYQY